MSRVVTDETFEAEIIKADHPVLVDVWASWCMPCRSVARELEFLEHKYLGLDVVKIDADSNPQVIKNYGIMGLPTMLYFYPGQPMISITGAAASSVIEQRFGLKG